MKKFTIRPRCNLVPILRMKKAGSHLDKKKELDKKRCRLDKWFKYYNNKGDL
jgi:hypothetical protein